MSTPVPSIGRIVIFQDCDGHDRPSIITQVFSNILVDLYVFPRNSGDASGGSQSQVPLVGSLPDPNNGRCWRWMPYQIQTAGQRYDDKPKGSEVVNMSFGDALSALREGKAIQRDGWNGKGLRVLMQRPDEHSKMTLPYLYIEYPDGRRCPWLASQTDILAEDWRTV